MAVALETWQQTSGTGVTSLTLGVTSLGSDRCLVALAGNSSGGGGALVSDITYGGSSFNANEVIDRTFTTGFNFLAHSIHYRVDPNIASTDVVVSWGSTRDEAALGVGCFSGVDQTTPIGDSQFTDGAAVPDAITVTCGSVGEDDFLIDLLYFYESANDWNPVPGANQTEQAELYIGVNVAWSTQDGADGGVMSWDMATGTGAVDGAGLCAVVVKPAPPPPLFSNISAPNLSSKRRSYRPRPFGPGIPR